MICNAARVSISPQAYLYSNITIGLAGKKKDMFGLCQGERETASKNRSRKPPKPQNATRKASSSTTSSCCAGPRRVVLTKNDYEEEKAYTFSKEQNEDRIKKIEALRNRADSNDNRRHQDTNAHMFDRFTYRSDPSYARKLVVCTHLCSRSTYRIQIKMLTLC